MRESVNREPGDAFGRSVYDWLVMLFIVLIPFQNTALQRTPLKGIVASPSIVPLLFLLSMKVAKGILESTPKMSRSTILLAAYVGIVCGTHIVTFDHGAPTLWWKPLVVYGTGSALTLFAIVGVSYRANRTLRIALYAAFVITVLGVVFDLFVGPSRIHLLQATPNLSGRLRGFSTEASTLSVQLVTSGMLAAHFFCKAWEKWFAAIITCVLLVYSGSKGGLIGLILCTIILVIVKTGLSTTSKILLSCLLVPVAWLSALLLFSQFTAIVEANETSSIATRLSMAVYAVITVAHNPFGVGFTGFLPSIPRYLPEAMHFVQGFFPFPLWFYEVKEYLYPPFPNADCKTFFFDFIVFFGIPFAVVFVKYVYWLLTELIRQGCNWLFVGTLFSVVALMTYYSTLNAYAIPVLIGISLHEIKRHEASVCLP